MSICICLSYVHVYVHIEHQGTYSILDIINTGMASKVITGVCIAKSTCPHFISASLWFYVLYIYTCIYLSSTTQHIWLNR